MAYGRIGGLPTIGRAKNSARAEASLSLSFRRVGFESFRGGGGSQIIATLAARKCSQVTLEEGVI
jgi:hypothetical protein